MSTLRKRDLRMYRKAALQNSIFLVLERAFGCFKESLRNKRGDNCTSRMLSTPLFHLREERNSSRSAAGFATSTRHNARRMRETIQLWMPRNRHFHVGY